MRLFFGLTLPPHVREATDAYARRASCSIPGRYAPGGNHHLTLAFLGEVEPQRVQEAAAILAACAGAFPAPQVTVTAPSHFGRAENAILILRAESEPPLAPLHDALCDALRAALLPCDPGPFSPHVTLARHARLSGAQMPPFSPVRFKAAQAHVFLSARDSQNVLRYTPIAEASFLQHDAGCIAGEVM